MSKADNEELDAREIFNAITGENLKNLRTAKKMHLKDVSTRTGISLGTLSNYENGKTSPSLPELHALLLVYEVSLAEFFKDTYYEDDLKVFERYGLSESFLKALLFDKRLKEYNIAGKNIAENINLIFESPFYSTEIFKNLNLFFNYELHERINDCIKEDSPLALTKGDCGRIFLHSIAESLTSIFNSNHNDEQKSSLKLFSEEQSKRMLAVHEEYLKLAEEHNKKPTGTS